MFSFSFSSSHFHLFSPFFCPHILAPTASSGSFLVFQSPLTMLALYKPPCSVQTSPATNPLPPSPAWVTFSHSLTPCFLASSPIPSLCTGDPFPWQMFDLIQWSDWNFNLQGTDLYSTELLANLPRSILLHLSVWKPNFPEGALLLSVMDNLWGQGALSKWRMDNFRLFFFVLVSGNYLFDLSQS